MSSCPLPKPHNKKFKLHFFPRKTLQKLLKGSANDDGRKPKTESQRINPSSSVKNSSSTVRRRKTTNNNNKRNTLTFSELFGVYFLTQITLNQNKKQ